MPDSQAQLPTQSYVPSNSEDGQSAPLPLSSPGLSGDSFSHDPGFLASQEGLRYMLFTVAQSGAPTRVGSPDGCHDAGMRSHERGCTLIRSVFLNARRIEYLKNYVGEVAPWVSVCLGLSLLMW